MGPLGHENGVFWGFVLPEKVQEGFIRNGMTFTVGSKVNKYDDRVGFV